MYEDQDDEDMVYVVSDIDKFVDETRKIVFGCFGDTGDLSSDNMDTLIDNLKETDIEELNRTLSHEECMVILHTYVKPKITRRKKKKYIIPKETFEKIVEDFNARLVSNLLTSLVQKGLIESAFDEEENDFIFWVKDIDEEQNEQD
jgi:hypothetical protein